MEQEIIKPRLFFIMRNSKNDPIGVTIHRGSTRKRTALSGRTFATRLKDDTLVHIEVDLLPNERANALKAQMIKNNNITHNAELSEFAVKLLTGVNE